MAGAQRNDQEGNGNYPLLLIYESNKSLMTGISLRRALGELTVSVMAMESQMLAVALGKLLYQLSPRMMSLSLLRAQTFEVYLGQKSGAGLPVEARDGARCRGCFLGAC